MKANVPVAVITGGSEGIGFACASFFARKGYKTCLVARNAEKLECARSRRTACPEGSLASAESIIYKF